MQGDLRGGEQEEADRGECAHRAIKCKEASGIGMADTKKSKCKVMMIFHKNLINHSPTLSCQPSVPERQS